MTLAINMVDVIKDYRTHRALDQVNLQVGPGITGLLGPNGAGKSTLIKVLLGLVATTSGSGSVLGLDIRREGRAIRGKIGYMPEDDAYIPGMSGVEMVRFTAALNGLPTVEGLRRSHEILDFCGMGQERYRDVETYSTGMRQKLKFAQAIVHDPSLLILDEPTSGLDPEERVAMLNRVRTLVNRHGMTALISTHILPDVRQVCDHVVILAAGKVNLSASMVDVDRPEQPGLYVRTLDEVDGLYQVLQQQNPVTKVDEHHLLLSGEWDGREHLIWQAATEVGAIIDSIYPLRNSLEAVFMKAVRESQHAHP